MTESDISEPGSKFFQECAGNPHLDARYGCRSLGHSAIHDRLRELWHHLGTLASAHRVKPLVMHGSLIGCWFNNRLLPWDDDIDVCFVGDDIDDVRALHGHERNSVRFEVNPNSVNRSATDRENVIDARLICTRTGLFIDVTFLTPVADGVVACKSPHHYELSDLMPLQRSLFEGVEAYVPANVGAVLESEYGSLVGQPRFNDWHFENGEWYERQEEPPNPVKLHRDAADGQP